MQLQPLGGTAVELLLVQLALLLFAARLGAEMAKRVGLPAVVGELMAGIALGPSLFGHFAPVVFRMFFPASVAQFHLLDVVGTLGMVLLLLLTGLETDLRLLKNLGRPALVASMAGMVVPFAMGFGLGMLTPAAYVAQPQHRVLFSLFLATAMSISAMPVIAKILMDLDLTRRNLGLVILSAGVVDDTMGWLILSLVAGAASHGTFRFGELLLTVVFTGAFLVGCAILLYPFLRWALKQASQAFRTRNTDLVLIMVVTCLCAALTEAIGIHAVFGAFVAGVVLRQVPSLREDTVHRLESFVFAVLAPVFFGIVGLKVDLWTLGSPGMLVIVLTVACLGKLVGVTGGGLWSGMRFWEAASIAVAMNARGAMELVVATIGLSLGILNPQMFSIIVVVAIVTSFMAPVGLRLTMRFVRMTEEEARRIALERSKGVFDPARVRILVPTAGGPNAVGAARLAFGVAKRSDNPVGLLYIEPQSSFWSRLWRSLQNSPTGRGIDEHLSTLKGLAAGALAPEIRRAASRSVADAICEEAKKGYDVVMLGASQHGASLGGTVLEDVVSGAPCHVAIVKTVSAQAAYRRVLVPIDGSAVTRVAAEFAVRYAEVMEAELTLALLVQSRPPAFAYLEETGGNGQENHAHEPEENLERISPVFRASSVRPTVLRLDHDSTANALGQVVSGGSYDLVVLGAENRAIQNRLFFGYDNERLIQTSPVTVVIVVPNLSRVTAPAQSRA
jgi:Kef-type K+ transport system membrane component KefB/nucleotide-binding universal stress UspA family protein